ncbi:MAG: BlaI/MecI/CopY family transcriptional regulator [Gemmatimonadetes bacterium]|nr:BlaI/MecI/CopY family transcriptional regulator [Gemmatimonadota bacterium]
MTAGGVHPDLGRRERQIMDVLYQLGRASVADVRELLPDPPSYSAVRGMLRLLEDKEYVRHVQEGARYIYSPRRSRSQATKPALRHLVQTFFQGSTTAAIASLVESAESLSDDDLDRLAAMVERARQRKGR